MLNMCEEDLILTQKQLHSVNTCSAPADMQIPFLDLRRALENIEHLKVIGDSFGESHVYFPAPNLNLSPFHSLLSLTLQDVDFKGVPELGNISDSLQRLTVRAAVDEIREVLIWVDEDSEERSPAPWNSLQHLDLSRNHIEIMDESLQLLIQLASLDLSYNNILSINNIQGLPYLRELKLAHNCIIETTALHLKLGNISKLDLSFNRIKSLQGFERLYSLEELELSNNCIRTMSELGRLTGLPQLEKLAVSGNPISRKLFFRRDVVVLFHHRPGFCLDGEPFTLAEYKKVHKTVDLQREIEVHLEEPLTLIEVNESDDSIELGEPAISFCEVSLSLAHPSKRPSTRLTTAACISETEDSDEEPLGGGSRKRADTVVFVEDMVRLDGDNWIGSFMDGNEFEEPEVIPVVVEVSEVNLKTLEVALPTRVAQKPRRKRVLSGSESLTSTASSKESKTTSKSPENSAVCSPKPEAVPFHIVPNEVYNIDEKIEDLVLRYSNLAFDELQRNYSVYREGTLFVVSLVPNYKPDKPELIEIQPKGGKITWSLYPADIEECVLTGDQIRITKVGDEEVRVYSQLFLHDTAHLYLLVELMRGIREAEPDEDANRLPSDRIFTLACGGEWRDELHTFPTHCYRYCKADTPLPVVVAVTETEVFVVEIEGGDTLLTLNQDMLAQILTEGSSCLTVIHRDKITNIRQIYRSYFQHTVRIEFKEEDNPFGSPQTTFSLLGFNNSDIEIFMDTVSSKLDAVGLSPSEVFVTEQEDDLRKFKKALRSQDLQQIKCVSIRLESRYFRCLVMTESFLYILEEDFVRWPPPCFVRRPPLTPRYSVVEQVRTRFMFGITLYSEIYHGSYILSLNFYRNLKTFDRGRCDVFVCSFENREQIVGHIKRTWRQFYDKNLLVSNMKRYEGDIVEDMVDQQPGSKSKEFTVAAFPSVPIERVQGFLGDVLGDSYNVLYRSRTNCLASKIPDREFLCILIVTTENVHVLVDLPHPTPDKILPAQDKILPESESRAGSLEGSRVSDNLAVLLSHAVTDVSQIVCGVFEQKIRLEFGFKELGLVTFMTRDLAMSRDIQKAIFEALHCQYQTDSYDSDDILITRKGRELSIIHLDEDRLDELRYIIAKEAGISEYDDVQILCYHLLYREVGESRDMITCVITSNSLYLIKEDNLFWPLPQSNQHRMPNTVQFRIEERIPLEEMVSIHYSHFTSCDIFLLYENSELHANRSHQKCDPAEEFYLVETVEKLGKTVTLYTSSYQERDQLIRTLSQMRTEHLPVSKLE